MQATTSSANTDRADIHSILGAIDRMTAAFHDGDLDTVMDSYEDPATVVFEPGRPVTAQAEIRAAFQEAFQLNPRFTYSGHEVLVAGDTALHLAPWTMTGRTPDGQRLEQGGLSVAVLRRQADGQWRMIIDHPHGQHLLSLETA